MISQDLKIIVGIGALTALLLLGGVYFLSKNAPKPPSTEIFADQQKLLIKADSLQTASGSGKLALVEFGDFQCPACQAYNPIFQKIKAHYGDKLNYVFRHFPLPIHPNAKVGAYAAEAANKQGKFWEMEDLLYTKHDEWANLPDPSAKFIEYAQSLGLNIDQFKKDSTSQTVKDKVERDLQDASALQLQGTPTIFIGNEQFLGDFQNYQELKTAIDKKLSQ